MTSEAIEVQNYWKGSVLPDEKITFSVSRAKLLEVIEDTIRFGGKLKIKPSMKKLTISDLEDMKVVKAEHWISQSNEKIELITADGFKIVMQPPAQHENLREVAL